MKYTGWCQNDFNIEGSKRQPAGHPARVRPARPAVPRVLVEEQLDGRPGRFVDQLVVAVLDVIAHEPAVRPVASRQRKF